MNQEIKDRHRQELAAAQSEPANPPAPPAGDTAKGERAEDTVTVGSEVDKVAQELGGMSVEDQEKEKRNQKRAKAQRKREKQREKVCVPLYERLLLRLCRASSRRASSPSAFCLENSAIRPYV